jgi:hypothetical protein
VRRRLIATAALAVAAGACASAAPPPGGPEDHSPPLLVRVTPDTNAVNVTAKVVSFQFDETINDRGSGAQELSNYFIVSPSDGASDISWHRSRIDVRPHQGFRPNTAYTVTLLPGLADLRGNIMKRGAEVVFSTGAVIPALRIAGTAFDWTAERPAQRALLQAITADSVTYLAQSDSAGRFSIGPLPAGSYLVRAVIDANGNHALDRNEAFDTLRVVTPQASPIELLAIVRDTLPPRIVTVAVADSLALRVTFDRPLEPSGLPGSGAFRLAGKDSVAIPITSVVTPRQEIEAAKTVADARADSVHRADSIAKKVQLPVRRAVTAPSARAATAVPSRPAPPTSLLLRLVYPLATATTYRLRVTEARSLSGRAATSERTFTTPKPAPPPRARAAADSVRPTTARPVPTVAPARPPR